MRQPPSVRVIARLATVLVLIGAVGFQYFSSPGETEFFGYRHLSGNSVTATCGALAVGASFDEVSATIPERDDREALRARVADFCQSARQTRQTELVITIGAGLVALVLLQNPAQRRGSSPDPA